MKRKVYIHKQAIIFLPSNYVEGLSSGVYKYKINNTQSIGRLLIRQKLKNSGEILSQGIFSIPKSTIDYLKLTNKQEVEFEIIK